MRSPRELRTVPAITKLDTLPCLDEPTLNVTRLSHLYSCIHETFTTHHSKGRRILGASIPVSTSPSTKPSASGVKSSFAKRGRVLWWKPNGIRRTSTLLAHTGRHFGDVNERTLGAGDYHLLDVIILLQILLRELTGCITSQIKL